MNAEKMKLESGTSCNLSTLIGLLTEAKNRWGDKAVWIHDWHTDSFYLPAALCLHEGFDYHDMADGKMDCMEDTVCIEFTSIEDIAH